MFHSRFDRDGGGSVDAEELGMLLLQLGQRLSDQDLRAMIAAVDLDGSGEIEFDEFLVMIKNKAKMDAIKEGKPVHQISYRDYGVRTFCSVNKPSEPRQSVRRRENATSMKPEYGHATTKNGAWVVPVGSIIGADLSKEVVKSKSVHPYAALAWRPPPNSLHSPPLDRDADPWKMMVEKPKWQK